MHYVYILYSPLYDKFYIGETASIQLRVEQHRSGFFTASSTRYTKDWELKLSFLLANRAEARKLELYLKSMKSKEYLRKLILNLDFLNEFKAIAYKRIKVQVLQTLVRP